MKHNLKITLILLIMFLATQLIGLAVINAYSPKTKTIINETTGQLENITIPQPLPYGLQPPEMKPEMSLTSIIIAFIIAILLVLLLMRIRATFFLKLWFFFVVLIALSVTLNAALSKLNIFAYVPLIIAFPLAFYKTFRQNLLVHNLTELLIYPGIAAIFVPILNIWAVVLLLLLISVYDIYAVWHSGFMQKMAKFQINKLKVFAGFFVPYVDKKTKLKIKTLKQKYKDKKITEKQLGSKKIRVNLAILGGGDVVFPVIMTGVVFRALGFLPAINITIFATLSLLFLFISAKKGKFYPAMPFITAGCLFGLLVGYLLYLL
jgi:presenilin-like A22 family membrane protease